MSAYDITEFLRTAYRPFAYCVPSISPLNTAYQRGGCHPHINTYIPVYIYNYIYIIFIKFLFLKIRNLLNLFQQTNSCVYYLVQYTMQR